MKGKKTGGRTAGTPNKATAISKRAISQLLADYEGSGKMEQDFEDLEPKERLAIAERLMQYVMPKMQSTAVDITATNDGKKTIEDRLAELSKPVETK